MSRLRSRFINVHMRLAAGAILAGSHSRPFLKRAVKRAGLIKAKQRGYRVHFKLRLIKPSGRVFLTQLILKSLVGRVEVF
jgi:hypothetical protein